MNGLEALAYLNEKRGENCVHDTRVQRWKFRMTASGHIEHIENIFMDGILSNVGEWIKDTYEACPGPSKPEVSEYEKDINSLAASHDFGLIPGVAVTNLFKVIEKHYVRRGDK